MGNFAQRHIVIAVFGQGSDELRQARHIADGLWYFDAIKVGAEADTVDAETVHQVIDVAHQRVQWRIRLVLTILAQHRDSEVEPDYAIRFSDRVQLFVGQVARQGAEGMDVRMGRHQWCIGEGSYVPEALLVEEGTPWAKTLGRLQTRPSERNPAW